MPFKSEVERKLYAREYYRDHMRKRRAKKLFDLEQFLNDISHCEVCKTVPAVYLTSKEIPVCKEHWSILADAPVEWTEEGNFKVCIVKN